jgi:hypothetical protein
MPTRSSSNGDWMEMKRLVLARMDEHKLQLDALTEKVSHLDTQVAVLCDREDRELLAARSVAMRWATAVGAVVAGLVSATIGALRGH